MHYIIIGIIAIVVVVIVIKYLIGAILYLLFNPRLNSVINIIGLIVLIVLVWNTNYRAASIVFGIAIIDCIRDIKLADKLYESFFDPVYVKKSLLTIFTLGLARVIFLFIIVPGYSHKASSDIKKALDEGLPMKYYESRKDEFVSNYWYFYGKKLAELSENGTVISNAKTLHEEMAKSKERLEKMYPKKLMGKIVNAVAGSKEMKQMRDNAQNQIKYNRGKAYLSAEAFKKIPQAITDAMSKRSLCSAAEIKDFKELKCLHFEEKIDNDTQWAVYFIIMALQPLVESGEFTDEIVNDNDVLDNHAYQYIRSEVKVNSIYGNANPLLALEDDDDD